MSPKTFAILSSIAILLFVIELIRRQKMTFKYSLSWLGISMAALFFSFYDESLYWLSRMAGFALPSNFIFFLLLVFFFILCLLLTLYINEQHTRSEILAQSIAMLEFEIQKLRGESGKKRGD